MGLALDIFQCDLNAPILIQATEGFEEDRNKEMGCLTENLYPQNQNLETDEWEEIT